jgi:hypothetical protein
MLISLLLMLFRLAATFVLGSKPVRWRLRLVANPIYCLSDFVQIYDVLTWFSTIIMLDYMCGPFLLYDVPNGLKVCLLTVWDAETLQFWSGFYFIPHVMCVVAFFALPEGKDKKKSTEAVSSSALKRE